MKNKQIAKALKFNWEPMLKRDLFAFVVSFFQSGNSKKAFNKIGVTGCELVSFMFNNRGWYWSDDFYKLTKSQIDEWLSAHKILELSNQLDVFYVKNKERILKLIKNPELNTEEKTKEALDILTEITTYIWAAHLLEDAILPKLKEKAAKYIKGDIDKFIGDASFPEKKNKLEQMEDEIRQGVSFNILAKKYGWMRVRDGFSRGYNIREISEYAKTLKPPHIHNYPTIPKSLKNLFSEARELVYFRTQRTDIFFELIFLARPLFRAIAKKHGISFNEVKYYTIHSLLNGRPTKYSKNFSCISYKSKTFFFDEPIFLDSNIIDRTEIKGMIAQPGIIKGIAKVVMKVSESNKVKKGDILVTYMTSPNFLPAMKLSAAFVTDEGGLTCHAAIVAREIKKPCIIGTRIATKIFKDGDLIEVDANKGVVRLLKR